MAHFRARLSFGLISAVVVGYALFRANAVWTSVHLASPRDLIAIALFALAEVFVLTRALGYFYNVYRASVAEEPDISFDLPNPPDVTILIPTAGEPLEILQKTVVAARYIDYPNKRILLLDGTKGGPKSPAALLASQQKDVEYFLVPFPRHGAKAGAINEALPQIHSPYIAILDADYRPGRNFLKYLLPHLESDPALAFIQTPQFYGNLTESVVSRAAQLQQAFFYEHISEGKAQAGAMFMCGTNLVVRTNALKDVGGFAEWSITEDFATSFLLALNGKHGSYNNITAAYGDGPQNLQQYYRQQYRWARGTVGTFLHMLPQLLNPRTPLSLGQRLEYLQSGTHYFIGFAWAIFVALPFIYIHFRVPVSFANPEWYLVAYLPYLIATAIYTLHSFSLRQYRKHDWFDAESLSLLTVPVYIRACLDAFIGRKATFTVTKKNAVPNTVPRSFLLALLLFTILSLWTLVVGIAQIRTAPLDLQLALMVNLFWIAYHLAIAYDIPIKLYAARQHATNK